MERMENELLECRDVRLFAEYKQTMGYLNIHLLSHRFSEKYPCESVINVEDDIISVTNSLSCVTFKFKDLKFEPSTCRNLLYERRGEISCTLQVEKPTSELVAVKLRNNILQEQFVREIKASQNKCYCKLCGQKILKDSCHFLRVLPLPSENWSDFSDMWFCHNHSHSSNHTEHAGEQNDVVSDVKLRPKLKDCFVAETYFMILSDQIKERNVRITQDACIYCNRCRNLLGEVNREENGVTGRGKVLKFLRSSLHFLTEENSLSEREIIQHGGCEVEGMFANLLMENSRLYTSFRLYLNSSTDGKEFDCLIWIIDPKLMIFYGSSHSTTVENLIPVDVVKVLFRVLLTPGNNRQEERNSWKKDNSVHMISLPYSSCLTLLKILIDNAKCLPLKCRQHDKFNVGFLKYQQEKKSL
ncbi:E3 ubiquitin-protein ligase E3D-like [Saccostrea echinata]|uniref:E3 ubiquitin-protein ligase E3D-like n=1 Tax=Saccostrea echinata TaxID=191078 RepID=UPI002A83D1C2|nr:E3 ubiquitin-protein ligase E3D-like [Saccostrea echinata]